MRQHQQAYHAQRVHLRLLCQYAHRCRAASSAATQRAGEQWGTLDVVLSSEQDTSDSSMIACEGMEAVVSKDVDTRQEDMLYEFQETKPAEALLGMLGNGFLCVML